MYTNRNGGRYALLLSIVCLLNACQSNYYYLVRHAEKAASPREDPPLCRAGALRALALRDSLSGKSVTKVFVSQYLRTKQTAEPLATLQQISPTSYDASAPVSALADMLRTGSGANVLVVGHSNTIPDLVLNLTGSTVPAIPDSIFNRLYIIRRVKDWNGTRYTLDKTGIYGQISAPCH